MLPVMESRQLPSKFLQIVEDFRRERLCQRSLAHSPELPESVELRVEVIVFDQTLANVRFRFKNRLLRPRLFVFWQVIRVNCLNNY